MGSFDPAQIQRGNVLVIAEQKRIGIILITHVGEGAGRGGVARSRGAGKEESRVTTVQLVRAVRAWNIEGVQPIVFADVDVLRSQTQPRVSDGSVNQNGGGDGVSTADDGALDSAGRGAGLSVVDGRTASLAQRLRVYDVGRRDAVAAKHRSFVNRIVVDL